MKNKGIAIAGCLISDIEYTIDKYPQKGNLTRIYQPVHHTGGANNILIDLARLDKGLPLKVSGLVGEDDNGRFILDTLREYPNIDTKNISARGRTAVTYAMVEKETRERTFFFDPGNSFDFNISDIDFEHLDADFFLLEYLLALGTLDEEDEIYGTKAAKVLHEAQRRGMKTFIDMVSEESDRYEKVVIPALKYVDCYISNEVEAGRVTGIKLYDESGVIESNMWEALKILADMGISEWVIVHSPACGYGLNCKTGEAFKVPSIRLPQGYIKGTTGAGDAFAAGVMYSVYKDAGLKEALEAGARCAACSLSAKDSNSGVKSFDKLHSRKSHSK